MEIDAYLLWKITAIFCFVIFGSWSLRRLGMPFHRALILTSFSVFSGFVLSRVWFIIQNAFGSDPYAPANLADAWNDAGSVLYGWILGGVVTAYLFIRLWKYPILKTLDALPPWVLVAQILNRFGCFAGECCWGKPSNAFWAVYSHYQKARLHPVQLYEAGWDFLLLLVLYFYPKKGEGQRTFLYIAGYPLGRFFIEFYRGDNKRPLWV